MNESNVVYNLWLSCIGITIVSLSLVACSSNSNHIRHNNGSLTTQLTCTTPTGESKIVRYFYSEDSTPHFIDLSFDGKTYHLEESPASGQIYLTQIDSDNDNDHNYSDKGLMATAHKMGLFVEAFEDGSSHGRELFSCEL